MLLQNSQAPFGWTESESQASFFSSIPSNSSAIGEMLLTVSAKLSLLNNTSFLYMTKNSLHGLLRLLMLYLKAVSSSWRQLSTSIVSSISLPPGLRIRIRIGSGCNRVSGSGYGFGIRIRIQEGKNDPQK